MAELDAHPYNERLWVPNIYRNLSIDKPDSAFQSFIDEADDVTGRIKQPRLEILTAKEAQLITKLGESSVAAVNEVLKSGLPETINNELENVLTTGLRILKSPANARHFLTIQIADGRLFEERQVLLRGLYKSSGKIPAFMKDFRWEAIWGQVQKGIDPYALPNSMEYFRPSSVTLDSATIHNPKPS